MELRMNNPRATKDIDLTVKDRTFFSDDATAQNSMILRALRSYASIDLRDFFIFQIEEPRKPLTGPVYGGARFHVVAQVDGRRFVDFNLDVGVDNTLIEPLEVVKGEDWLGFAGIHTKGIPVLSIEQHFAEKIHAYTLPRDGQINSRVKDLIDMILLIRTQRIKGEKLKIAIEQTFKHRKSHKLPDKLSAPPNEWEIPFSILAKNCSLSITSEDAFKEVTAFMEEEIIGWKIKKLGKYFLDNRYREENIRQALIEVHNENQWLPNSIDIEQISFDSSYSDDEIIEFLKHVEENKVWNAWNYRIISIEQAKGIRHK